MTADNNTVQRFQLPDTVVLLPFGLCRRQLLSLCNTCIHNCPALRVTQGATSVSSDILLMLMHTNLSTTIAVLEQPCLLLLLLRVLLQVLLLLLLLYGLCKVLMRLL